MDVIKEVQAQSVQVEMHIFPLHGAAFTVGGKNIHPFYLVFMQREFYFGCFLNVSSQINGVQKEEKYFKNNSKTIRNGRRYFVFPPSAAV